ncbi:MAG: hypothetical protein NC180_03635 [Muribaculaceae bacterium]|nr:hypothetical protein [Roseburia sp.]MCM1431216.1 hypothetical protein [Muribaculaceae bacterium]MCM1492298.1 hypothetical protein [Muribaculaceae bacterium]
MAPGIYYVHRDMYVTQFLVTSELNEKEYLYLKCLTNSFSDTELVNRLVADCRLHIAEASYSNYMHQLSRASAKKGAPPMICEGLLELFGTSSEEIIANTKKQDEEFYNAKLKAKDDYYQSQIQSLQEQVAQLQAESERLKQQQN